MGLLHYVCHPSIDGHCGCSHFGATVTNAAMKARVQGFVRTSIFISLGCVSRSRTAESHSISMRSILRNQQTDFQSSYTILHSHQQCTRVPISPNFTNTCFLFDDSHLNKREMVFHGFCLHFADDE